MFYDDDYDEYEYENDDDYYNYDDDDEYYEDDEEYGSSGGVSPFSGLPARSGGNSGSSNRPLSSRSLGTGGLSSGSRYTSGGNRDDIMNNLRRSGGLSGGESSRSTGDLRSSLLSGGSDDDEDEAGKQEDSRSRPGNLSGRTSSLPGGGNRFGSSSLLSGKSSSGGGGDKKSSSGGRDLRSSIRPSGSVSSKSDEKKRPLSPSEKKDAGTSLRSRLTGKKADTGGNSKKKDDSETRTSGSSGGFRSRLGGGNADSKKDAAGGGDKKGGSPLGGLRARIGGGGKSDSGAKDKSDGAGGLTAGLGGITGRLRGGSKADAGKKADKVAKSDSGEKKSRLPFRRPGASAQTADTKKPAAKAASKASKSGKAGKKDDDKSSGSGGRFGALGGLAGRLRGGSQDDADGGKKGATKASGGSKSPLAKSRLSKKDSDKKSGKAAKKSGKSTKSSKKSSGTKGTKAAAESSGVFSRIGGIFSRGGDSSSKSGKSTKSTRTKARAQTSKVPTTAGDEGLTLDNWLDILGVGLVFGSLVLFFSAISSEQAAIAAVHTALGQLLGWGAIGVPVGMFAVGMWLIVRHFGDDAPTVDPVRIAGVILGYVTILVVLQYADTFSERYAAIGDLTSLRINLDIAWQLWKTGGGLIGAEVYFFLVSNFTEIGGAFVLVFTTVLSLMLIFRVTMSEIAIFVIGLGRATRDNLRKRAAARRARKQLAAQQKAEATAQAALTTEPGEATPDGMPEVAPANGHGIRFNRGAPQVATATASAASATAEPIQFSVPVPDEKKSKRGGLGGFLRRNGNNGNKPPKPMPLPETPLPMDDHHVSMPAAGSTADEPFPVFEGISAPVADTTQEDRVASLGTLIGAGAAATAAAMMGNGSGDDAAAEDNDDVRAARQNRLNELRSGNTAMPNPAAQAAGANADGESDYNPFGKPDDLMTHPNEKLPYQEHSSTKTTAAVSQLPSVQPAGQAGIQQQSLRIDPQKPNSSEVKNQSRPKIDWRLPDYRTLLSSGGEQEFDRDLLLRQASIIEDTLESFGAPGRVVEVNTGPVITQFGVEPDYMTGRSGKKQRVKVSAIASLDKDLQLALGARSIRVEAPVPGKGYVGIEVPNAEASLVSLRDVMDSPQFQKYDSPLAIALGQSVSGAPISADLAAMPHLLIAGATGSGKSVCVNAIIASILAKNTPEIVRFIMVDPKRVELTGYNGIPHLLSPVVVDVERILGVLKWATREMDDRYKKFSQAGARNIDDYNKHRDPDTEMMPYIVIIIDELADLMMIAPEETERIIARIAALARATGLHLVIATQRPSVDVVTGLIKANFPARIAFAVASGIDSRVILDQPGAERLLGRGDMLYMSGNSPAPARLQGVFVSDMEINNINRYWKMQSFNQPDTAVSQVTFGNSAPAPISQMPTRTERSQQQSLWNSMNQPNLPTQMPEESNLSEHALTGDTDEEDELYDQAVELVRRLDKASISLLQRRLRIGYTRAARLIDVMEARNVVGPAKEGSSKPRDVLPA